MHQLSTPEGLFAAALAADPAAPLVTFYDDATGERAELSAKSLANWVAKTHFLLTDELGLGVGDRALLRLPTHWMALVVLFGAWSAGLEVVTGDRAAEVALVGPDGGAAAAGDVFALSLVPWGQGFSGPPPAGTVDFVAAVRPHADQWALVRFAATDADPALDGTSRAALVAAAVRRAADLGLSPGARLLAADVDGPPDVPTVLAPLTVGGSLVLIRHATVPAAQDPRRGQENVTHVA